MDYKDWIQNRAEELSEEHFGKDFYDLIEELQRQVYEQATEDYKDYYASQIDAAYDRAEERQLLGK